MIRTIPVYHCKCCGKVFPSTSFGLISCPLCGREYYDVIEDGHKALYSAVEQLELQEAEDFWEKNPVAIVRGDDDDLF